MDPFEVGDPYIEWEEANSAQEPKYEEVDLLDEFITKGCQEMQELKENVVRLLMSEHDFTIEEAEESVNESAETKPELWNENAEAPDLAKFLASDDDDE